MSVSKSASHEAHSELQENIGGMHLYATSILKSFLDGINQCRHLGASNPLPTSIESISIYESATLQFSRNYISRIVVSFEKVYAVLDRLCQGASLSIYYPAGQGPSGIHNVQCQNMQPTRNIYLYNLDTCLFQDSLEVYAQGCALVQPIQNRFHFIK